MDKGGGAVPAWEALGFGFSELGGITRHEQPGNPKPRMFRVVEDEALINRMGFNNPGADSMAERLRGWRDDNRWPSHPVGINLGKSKGTPLDEAPEDYLYSFQLLKNLADFFVVNVSSPNTPNLRQLQDKTALAEILAALQEANDSQRPILVKVAPDLGFDALDEILELIEPHNLTGLVATNTTIARPDETEPGRAKLYAETGGLSGRPLAKRHRGHPASLPADPGRGAARRSRRYFHCGGCLGKNHRRGVATADLFQPRLRGATDQSLPAQRLGQALGQRGASGNPRRSRHRLLSLIHI